MTVGGEPGDTQHLVSASPPCVVLYGWYLRSSLGGLLGLLMGVSQKSRAWDTETSLGCLPDLPQEGRREE